MTCERVFLGWQRPLIDLAAEYIVAQRKNGSEIDLSRDTLVVPGQRAGRRLLELLTFRAQDAKAILVPPRIITLGDLPEEFIENRKEIPPLASRLLWSESLGALPQESLETIVKLDLNKESYLATYQLASEIERLYSECCAHLLSFSEIAKVLLEDGNDLEAQRWNIFNEIYQIYLSKIESRALVDKHQARIMALEQHTFYERQLWLVGLIDPSPIAKKFIALSNSKSLIPLPQTLAGMVDQFGGIIPETWAEYTISIEQERINVAMTPDALGPWLIEQIKEISETNYVDDITIGCAIGNFKPAIKDALEDVGILAHDSIGQGFLSSMIGSLLAQLSSYSMQRDMKTFGTLTRHPLVRRYLLCDEVSGPPESVTDKYYSDHLALVTDDLPPSEEPNALMAKELIARFDALLTLFCEPQVAGGAVVELDSWCEKLTAFLSELLGELELDQSKESDRKIIESLTLLNEELDQFRATPQFLANNKLSASEVLQVLLDRLGRLALAPEYQDHAVELVGWLELLHDDAKILWLTGIQEGFVPENINHDPFLPNALRRRLGMVDNQWRYGRDALILANLLHSRQDFKFFVSQRDLDGQQLTPSRLLMSVDDAKLAKQVLHLFQTSIPKQYRPKTAKAYSFKLPIPPVESERIKSVSTTGFKDYLRCPYRFYLKHVLGLKTVTDQDLELNPLKFGTLVHEILGEFANSKLKDTERENEIRDYLESSLADQFARNFGRSSAPAVLIQFEQILSKLRQFATWQVDQRRMGWQIVHSELKFEEGALKIGVPDGSIEVKGRIDRIDFNPSENSWRVVDFKTGTKKNDPSKHITSGEWRDLQLPIYRRYLVESQTIDREPQLAILNLFSRQESLELCLAKWSDSDIESADLAISNVCSAIANQIFWPPSEKIFGFDEFAAVCGVGQFSDLALDEEAADYER